MHNYNGTRGGAVAKNGTVQEKRASGKLVESGGWGVSSGLTAWTDCPAVGTALKERNLNTPVTLQTVGMPVSIFPRVEGSTIVLLPRLELNGSDEPFASKDETTTSFKTSTIGPTRW